MTTEKQYSLIAVNEDATQCEYCGKTHLQRVMWIKENGTDDDAFPVGTTCGAKLLKKTASKINTIIRGFSYNIWSQKQVAIKHHPLYDTVRGMEKAWDKINERGDFSYTDNPTKPQIDAMMKQIRADVDAMTFSVQL
jgi:hypothetical protein